MSAHTPGPWAFDDGDVFSQAGVIGDIICDIPATGSASKENWQANARLIAAAPDLLSALNEMVSTFCDAGCHFCAGDCASASPPVMDCPHQVIQRARVAIAKATGA